jgi:hypothetical protein
MELVDIFDCGDYFCLCKNCNNITIFEFLKCHKCKMMIQKDKYKQYSSLDKYCDMLEALKNSKTENSMITISVKNDKNQAPELWQIIKNRETYKFQHLQENTHKKLEETTVYIDYFAPILNPNKEYEICLQHGPNIIYIYQ